MDAVNSCYVCAEMYREAKHKKSASEKLAALLGVKSVESESGFIYHLAHIPRTAVQWRMLVMVSRDPTTNQVLYHTNIFTLDYMLRYSCKHKMQYSYSSECLLITKEMIAFLKAHYISDVRLPRTNDTIGAQASITYVLGSNKVNMNFPIVPDSSLSKSHTVLLIKQCRLHYFCGSVDDVRELFESKELELKLKLKFIRKGKGGRRNGLCRTEVKEVSVPSFRLDKLKFRDFNALEDHTYDGMVSMIDFYFLNRKMVPFGSSTVHRT